MAKKTKTRKTIELKDVRRLLPDSERALLDVMSDQSKHLLLTHLQQTLEGGESNLQEALDALDYLEPPVPIEQYMTDHRYMGLVGDELYPAWKRELSKVYSTGSPVSEWILSGSTGGGKSFASIFGTTYNIYWLSTLREPQRYLGLAPDTPIVIGLFSLFRYKAEATTFGYLVTMLEKSPYFREKFPKDPNYKNDIVLPREVRVLTGSSALQAIGENLFIVSVDEADFMKKGRGEELGQAQALISAVESRRESRFMQDGGYVPGVNTIVSSATFETSFTSQRRARAQSDPRLHVSSFARWEVGKPGIRYSGKKFFVIPGTRLQATRVLPKDAPPPQGEEYIEVPIEHRRAFEDDAEAALRDVAGRTTDIVSPLIPRPERILACIDKKRRHPFWQDEITIDIADDDSYESYIDVEYLTEVRGGLRQPRLNPGLPRYFHVDIGLTGDCLGFALGHVSKMGWTTQQREDLTTYEHPAPEITIDLMLRVRPPQGSEIDLDKTVRFIFFLHQSLGFNIKRGSYDGFQSVHSIQTFKKAGWDVGKLSVDAKPCTPYLFLRAAILERRLTVYEYAPFIEEMTLLRRDAETGKVDHPKEDRQGRKGSKDVADGVAGVTWHCYTDPHSAPEGIRLEDYNQLVLPVVAAEEDPRLKVAWLIKDHPEYDVSETEFPPL